MADDKVGALKLAAAEGKIDEVKRLVEQASIPVDQPDEYGDTALHAAAQNGRNEIVKYLLAKGANPNVRNKVGSTPLHKLVASKYEQKSILKQLLKANADPTIRNGAGKLPEEFVKNKGILIELLGELAVTDEINIPKDKHGRVIGKGGQKMTEIRDETHCHITVPDHSDPSTAISVVGRQEGVTRAKELIKEAVAERKVGEDGEQVADGIPSVRYPLAKHLHKLVIGQGGRTINRIRDETDVQIFVPKVGDPDTAILLKGEPDNISKAIQEINKVTMPSDGERRGGFGGRGGRGGFNNTERRNSDGRGRGQGSDRRGSSDKIAIDFNIADNRGRNAPRRERPAGEGRRDSNGGAAPTEDGNE